MSQSRADTLRAHLESADASPRPILTSLNGDNSWLISFPRPAEERARPGSKAYFHIVSDPWLTGHAKAGSSWIMEMRIEEKAAIPSGAAVEAVIREIEDAAASIHLIPERSIPPSPALDAIFLNFHFIDHLDEATLRTFDRSTPVFATRECAARVRRWNYFTSITEQRDLDPASNSNSKGWPSLHPGGGLPDWLSVFRLPGHSEANFATAIVYSSSPSPHSKRRHETLLYAPHGIKADQPTLRAFLSNLRKDSVDDNNSSSSNDDSAVSVLAILHCLKDGFSLGKPVILGVAGGLALERLARPRYWVVTHDVPVRFAGVVPKLMALKDVERTLQSGLEEERNKSDKVKTEGGERNGLGREPNVVEVKNGACFVLE